MMALTLLIGIITGAIMASVFWIGYIEGGYDDSI